MLIRNKKQTQDDISIWNDYAEMDRIRVVDERKIQRSLGVIWDFWERKLGDVAAFTSWGKDSVVLMHLIAATNLPIPCVYIRHDMEQEVENPDALLVRDAFLSRYDIDYRENWQTEQSTHKHRVELERYGANRITGLRNDESGVRLLQWKIDRHGTGRSCRPLALWKNEDIFAYIEQKGLPLSPCYAYLGGGLWDREKLRMHSIKVDADCIGSSTWEDEYYFEEKNRLLAQAGRA